MNILSYTQLVSQYLLSLNLQIHEFRIGYTQSELSEASLLLSF